jgi:hypothetical protein
MTKIARRGYAIDQEHKPDHRKRLRLTALCRRALVYRSPSRFSFAARGIAECAGIGLLGLERDCV